MLHSWSVSLLKVIRALIAKKEKQAPGDLDVFRCGEPV